MGRSITERPSLSTATFYHRASNRHYSITPASIHRHQLDANGQPINLMEKSVSLAIGSGNHAITYGHRTPQGRLLELPVSWYAKLNGYAMSPGYDTSDHLDFRREISDSCLFCHSTGRVPAAIECERCHGPSEAHRTRPHKGNILNPAHLVPQRQLDICLQCHLETASQGIVDSIRRPGRDVFSYVPGEPLAGYKSYFDRTDSAQTNRFEINHAGFRLMQSRCFLESKGSMTCTTCHDPHSAAVKTNSCVRCHKQPHTSADCVGCHMPKRTASDAIHTSMTDHKIVRRPSFVNPTREEHTPYRGAVVDFYTKADPLALALANLHEPVPDIYRRYLQRDPGNVPILAALGNALLRLNQPRQAAEVLEKAVQLDSRDTNAANYLAVSLAVQGNTRSALEILQKVVKSNPDHSLSWMNLATTHEALGDLESAIAEYGEVIRLQPDSTEARHRRKALAERVKK